MGIPLVSVIIPAYNSGNYIKETLNSVYNQTWKNLEVIVVDDGSTDHTLEVIKKFGSKIRLFNQENSGAPAARNKGFYVSNGEFIQYLDADDLLSPQKIEEQVKVLLEHNECIANGRWGRFYTNLPQDESIKWGPHESLQKDLDPVTWLCQNHMSTSHAWLTPKELISSAGPWDESLLINQDGEFFSRVVALSRKVFFCDVARVFYRSRLGDSITSKARSAQALESFYRTCLSFEKVLLPLEESGRTRLACANKYQEFVYAAYPIRKDLVKKAEQRIIELGGSNWPRYKGSRINNLLTDIFGWKFPARLRLLLK